MVDEFMVVCVDRIVASSATTCFNQLSSSSSSASSVSNNGVGNETENMKENLCLCQSKNGGETVTEGKNEILKKGGFDEKKASKGDNVKECRICQEEEDEKRMEAPCACSGTLKFAHRKCIQRWCNKKGDITCEICNQVFSPNYTSPPPRNNADVMTIDIRQAWGQHVDLRDPRFLAFAAAERQFLESEYEDYAVTSNGILTCFRSIAILLMLVLLIRQTLMLSRDFGVLQESSAFFHYQISVLQVAGFLLPCYVVARSWYIAQCRRRSQG